jgi:hypothetical protein
MYLLKKSTMTTEVDEELVLLDSMVGKYFGINALGKKMLEALLTDKEPREIAAAIVAEYDVAPETALKDLKEFIDALLRRGILEEVQTR